jgi:putative transposase
MVRRLIALDEACVRVNGLKYWVYAALDVDGNDILSIRVYPSRNGLAAEQFIREVLKYCDGKPTFIVDNAPWLKQALWEMGLTYNTESFR